MIKVDNSVKVDNYSNISKDITNITPNDALNMFKEGNVNLSSVKISDKGVVTFNDKSGNSYRTELSKEQIKGLEQKISNQNTKTFESSNVVGKNKLDIVPNKEGTAKKTVNLFDDKSEDKKDKELNINPSKNDDNKWNFKFYFGYNRTKYFDTDMHLKSSRLDVTVKDFSFKERTSSDFYNPKTWESAQDAFRWIDEPTNSFILNAENKNNVLYFTAFHPKFLKQDFQEKHVTGTVDGVQVDKVMPINEKFDGYNNQPGEMHLTRFESTHKQMDWQVGYGRNITLLENEKAGKLVYTPSVHVGVTSGKHVDVYVKENEYWDFDNYEDKTRIQGANVGIGNRLMYEKGKVSVFAENRMNFSHLEHQFMDGKAEYNMKYMNTTFGVGFKLFETKPKSKPVE
jgi:hypothetical protein